jgi:hypothetical protein
MQWACERKMSGLQRSQDQWPTPYKKDKALYSPTSASEMKRINVERGAEESFLTDNDKLI